MKNMLLFTLMSVMLIGCISNKVVRKITLQKTEKVVLKKEGPAEFFYWEMDNAKQLWKSELGAVTSLYKYRDSLKIELGGEGLKQAIKKEATQTLPKNQIEKEENGDAINALLVHTGTLGKIRSINFLEAQLLNYQVNRYPLLSHPTEFHGFIAMHEEAQKVRVYFASSDTEWSPKPQVIIEQLEKDLQKGWKLKYHLHNHYCKKDKNYIGILAPSLADAQYFKMLSERFNISKALITNGFHTVEIDHSEFYKFESH